MTSRPVPEQRKLAVPRPLLPAAVRRTAAALLGASVAVAAILGTLSWHQTRPGWLDRWVDTRIQASVSGHRAALNAGVQFGDPRLVTVMTAALLLAYIAVRKWRGAVLVAVAVPAAGALTEYVLKPFIHRMLQEFLSYPSGHSTAVFALVTALGVLLCDPDRPRRPRLPAALRVLLALIAFLAACWVSVSVIGLGYHYFTDTVGGAAVGAAVVLGTAFLIDRLSSTRRWRRAAMPAALAAPDERHAGGHQSHELDVRGQRQTGHVHDRAGD
jgi:membrane-associated phospholipid phosphatase